MNEARFTLERINALTREEFARVIGPVFEQSPWIAEGAWAQRPFGTVDALHEALWKTVRHAGEEKQLELIRAHPDLVGRAGLAGALTAASAAEQAGAGLAKLTSEEIARFQKLNQAYHERFGFPFVICARQNKKEAILAGFQTRLANSRQKEIEIALEEIRQIAGLRLADLVRT